MPRAVPRPARDDVEFARNVLGLTDANSTEMDPTTPHPVIDLMHDQRDVTDKGGTMRLGAYYAVLEPGTKVAEAYGEPVVSERHRHRYEFNPNYRARLRGGRVRVQRRVARPAAGRVHRAARSPVLGRHPGPPGVQEPARPAPPAVPGARRRRPQAARRARRCSASLDAPRGRRRPDPSDVGDGFRHLGERQVHQGHIWQVVVAEFEAPDGDTSSATSCARRAPSPWCR